MSARPVEYHQGAVADVKSAVAWYRKRSPKAALDFIEELHRAVRTIRQAPDGWPIGENNLAFNGLTRRAPMAPQCHLRRLKITRIRLT
ncbi:MAG: type II toxin-antitoxin system RelE/ParE family toxin [Acidobacteriia bacterium]|nr:type II toxin-antitoxin system RelE/ParE family toxin [Terriglobia bacterium]